MVLLQSLPDGEVLAFLQALVDEDRIPMREQIASNAEKEEGGTIQVISFDNFVK